MNTDTDTMTSSMINQKGLEILTYEVCIQKEKLALF
jgi:hypothetical protein